MKGKYMYMYMCKTAYKILLALVEVTDLLILMFLSRTLKRKACTTHQNLIDQGCFCSFHRSIEMTIHKFHPQYTIHS